MKKSVIKIYHSKDGDDDDKLEFADPLIDPSSSSGIILKINSKNFNLDEERKDLKK